MAVRIKRAHNDAGGYFDPHTHFTGIIPYRALAMLTPEGAQLVKLWRQSSGVTPTKLVSPGVAPAKALTDHQIEDFLAHHTVRAVLKPPYKQAASDEQKELTRGLYDLETRLLVLQNLALGWGLVKADPKDMTRARENAGTLKEIIEQGCAAVADEIYKVSPGLAQFARPLPADRPDESTITKIIDGILQMDITLDNEEDYETGLPKVVRHANQNALTATPQNDFDSAYVARGLLSVAVDVMLAAGMREIRRQNIAYSEQSVPLWTFAKWNTDQRGDMAGQAVEEHEATGTTVRWLPMLAGTFLGWTGEPNSRNMLRLRSTAPTPGEKRPELPVTARTEVRPYNAWAAMWAETAPLTWPPETKPPKPVTEDINEWTTRLRAALRGQVRYAAGFDIASPERTWYTPAGAQLLQDLLWKVFDLACQERRRLVAHIHVGEGYAAFVDAGKTKVKADAKRSEQKTLPILYDTESHVPAHFLCAENNVEQMLRAVIAVRDRALTEGGPAKLAAFDAHIRVRFGHVTHASLLQAQQMADNRIWADVNLTSNLATGAITLTSQTEDVIISPSNPRLIKWAAEMVAREGDDVDLFEQHSLVTLLACRVPVVLGTDGGGIEHSFMEREYALARAILEQAVRLVETRTFTLVSSAKATSPVQLTDNAAKALKYRLDVARLYEYQHAHHAWATTAPVTPIPAIAPLDDDLDHELHNVFVKAVGGG